MICIATVINLYINIQKAKNHYWWRGRSRWVRHPSAVCHSRCFFFTRHRLHRWFSGFKRFSESLGCTVAEYVWYNELSETSTDPFLLCNSLQTVVGNLRPLCDALGACRSLEGLCSQRLVFPRRSYLRFQCVPFPLGGEEIRSGHKPVDYGQHIQEHVFFCQIFLSSWFQVMIYHRHHISSSYDMCSYIYLLSFT